MGLGRGCPSEFQYGISANFGHSGTQRSLLLSLFPFTLLRRPCCTTTEEVCEGLDLAVVKMKKGERAEITLAPQWAYGTVGADKPLAPVPADATVVYEVSIQSKLRE